MTLIAYVFPKLETAEDVVGQRSKKPRFRTPFDSQQAKGYQKLLESRRQHFCHIFSSLKWKLSLKMSLLVICEILGLFVKGYQKLLESRRQHFCHIFSSLKWKLSLKMSLLVICEILGLFVNTLTANDKYSLRNSKNLA